MVSPRSNRQGAPVTGLQLAARKYPEVRRDNSVVEYLHEVPVPDPYRWLEEADSEEVMQFVIDQNRVTEQVLKQCSTRDKFKHLLTTIRDYAKYGTPFKEGDRYYYMHNTGLQQQFVLYSMPDLHGDPRVVLDINNESEDGTLALAGLAFSRDGRMMAYLTASGGSDWNEARVLAIGEDGEASHLDDHLQYLRYTDIEWTHDNRGFFYCRYPAVDSSDLGTEVTSASGQQLRYHVVGTPQEDDPLLVSFPDNPQWLMDATVTEDGRFLLVSIYEGTSPANKLWVCDMAGLHKDAEGHVDFPRYAVDEGGELQLPLTRLVDDFGAQYDYVSNNGSGMLFQTNKDAPRNRLVAVDVSADAVEWQEILPQHASDVLQSAKSVRGDLLITRYLSDVTSTLQVRNLGDASLVQEVELPFLGSVAGSSGDREEDEYFFKLVGFTQPGSIYRLDLTSPTSPPELWRQVTLPDGIDLDQFETVREFATSADGTQIPLFIVRRKDIRLDGNNPTLLYGYGGFNVSMDPAFSVNALAFLLGVGGVYVSTCLRGGGEYGVEWRDAGSVLNKQNVFDDFQACADHLVANGTCTPGTLATWGGSNGGLLVAACANQRPDMQAAVVCQVGVLDMLRFHLFTIGHLWRTDFGDPDKPEHFKYISQYSPLHNIAAPGEGSQQYPAILLTTGDHDDRVAPLHSFKFLAEAQHSLAGVPNSPQTNPIVARIETRGGHGAGKPTSMVIAESADMLSFAVAAMGAAWVMDE